MRRRRLYLFKVHGQSTGGSRAEHLNHRATPSRPKWLSTQMTCQLPTNWLFSSTKVTKFQHLVIKITNRYLLPPTIFFRNKTFMAITCQGYSETGITGTSPGRALRTKEERLAARHCAHCPSNDKARNHPWRGQSQPGSTRASGCLNPAAQQETGPGYARPRSGSNLGRTGPSRTGWASQGQA